MSSCLSCLAYIRTSIWLDVYIKSCPRKFDIWQRLTNCYPVTIALQKVELYSRTLHEWLGIVLGSGIGFSFGPGLQDSDRVGVKS